jgi:hypothetical protein
MISHSESLPAWFSVSSSECVGQPASAGVGCVWVLSCVVSSWSGSLHAWLSLSSSGCVSHSMSASLRMCAGIGFVSLIIVRGQYGLLVRWPMVSRMEVCL